MVHGKRCTASLEDPDHLTSQRLHAHTGKSKRWFSYERLVQHPPYFLNIDLGIFWDEGLI